MKRAAAVGAIALLSTVGCSPLPSSTSPLSYRDLAGDLHSPLRVDDAPAHVLVFVTTDCPIANAYAPTLQRLARDFDDTGIRLYLIHVDPDIGAPEARRHAAAYDLPGHVILDPEHRLVERLAPAVTPEAVVLDQTGTRVYQGRIDNRWAELGRKRPRPTQHDLADALSAVLSGRKVSSPRTQAVGCAIPSR